jgi:hypothetical protein
MGNNAEGKLTKFLLSHHILLECYALPAIDSVFQKKSTALSERANYIL